jgi:hypothetical protein
MQSMLEKVITAKTQIQNLQQFSAMAQSLFSSGVLKMGEKKRLTRWIFKHLSRRSLKK